MESLLHLDSAPEGLKTSRGISMVGTFNGSPIDNVVALKILSTASGKRRIVTIRSTGRPSPELEQQFTLGSRVSATISIHDFGGKVVRYDRAVLEGVYEVIIEEKER